MGNADAIHFPRTFLDKSDFNFSFSGLKSAVRRYVQIHESDYRDHIPDIAASFQEAACEVMCHKLIHAAQVKNCTRIAVAGGVAANSRLRQTIHNAAFQKNFSVHIPSLELCGDNAAMIAAAGYHYLAAGNRSDLDDDVFSKSPIH